jgi:hypothetical protein
LLLPAGAAALAPLVAGRVGAPEVGDAPAALAVLELASNSPQNRRVADCTIIGGGGIRLLTIVRLSRVTTTNDRYVPV